MNDAATPDLTAGSAVPVEDRAASGHRTKVDVRNLDFFYGDVQALDSVNLAFEESEVTAIIGPSGCGKSTLLRALNRIYELYPDQRAEGEILIDGENVLDRAYSLSRLRRRVGMVFQKPTPFASSIRNNVGFALNFFERLSRAEANNRIESALRQAALWDEVKDRLHASALSLSGGQQQRLCIARTIATARIEELIDELRGSFTIVIVTHNMQQAARVSQNTAFFHLGKMIEYGHTSDIFTNPVEERTKDYITGRYG